MDASVEDQILLLTEGEALLRTELIQPLWNQYGTLSRVWLDGGTAPSVIVKHIQIPATLLHPRGFASNLSRDRKVRSYQVEAHWYANHNSRCPAESPTPKCLGALSEGGELFLVLEDLGNRGFSEVLYEVSSAEMDRVLDWLAAFHAAFLEGSGDGLWAQGTYWHLDTRPEELNNIRGTELHRYASLLDARLRRGGYPTLVHGDAKLANFLFTPERDAVAAVDFQYVGRGSAMKDVAYFVGSCLSGPECERREQELLDRYFSSLAECLSADVDRDALEREWRALYPVAWADFQRFMMGWSPGHRKLTDYSDATTRRAVDAILEELCGAAREACRAAGEVLRREREGPLKVESKGFESEAADVLTEVDLEAQQVLLECLESTIERYDLGVLAEEGPSDDSRLSKHAFWAVDPLDGTRFFVEGEPGYAVSVALISSQGEVLLGAVYDPSRDHLFEAVRGRGVTLNGRSFDNRGEPRGAGKRVRCFADRSLKSTPGFRALKELAEVRFAGGAVINALCVLQDPQSVYIKAPKSARGGGAIWDFAAVSLMLEESGGRVESYSGSALSWNRSDTVYFNDTGVVFLGAEVDPEDRYWERCLRASK